ARDFLEDTLSRLADAGLFGAGADQPRGCTPDEITDIEGRHGSALPSAYCRFLAAMGRSAGSFLAGTDFLYPGVLALKAQAERLLAGCKSDLHLHRTDFVFTLHQGYQFLFFRSGVSDDPPVFFYDEGAPRFEQAADAFSTWLKSCADDEIEAAKALHRP